MALSVTPGNTHNGRTGSMAATRLRDRSRPNPYGDSTVNVVGQCVPNYDIIAAKLCCAPVGVTSDAPVQTIAAG